MEPAINNIQVMASNLQLATKQGFKSYFDKVKNPKQLESYLSGPLSRQTQNIAKFTTPWEFTSNQALRSFKVDLNDIDRVYYVDKWLEPMDWSTCHKFFGRTSNGTYIKLVTFHQHWNRSMQRTQYFSGFGHICKGYIFFTTDPDVFLGVVGRHSTELRKSLIEDGIQLDESEKKKERITKFCEDLSKNVSEAYHKIWLSEEDENNDKDESDINVGLFISDCLPLLLMCV